MQLDVDVVVNNQCSIGQMAGLLTINLVLLLDDVTGSSTRLSQEICRDTEDMHRAARLHSRLQQYNSKSRIRHSETREAEGLAHVLARPGLGAHPIWQA